MMWGKPRLRRALGELTALPRSPRSMKGKGGEGKGRAGRGERETNGREKEREWRQRGKEDAIALLSDFLATPMPLGNAPATYFKTRVQATV